MKFRRKFPEELFENGDPPALLSGNAALQAPNCMCSAQVGCSVVNRVEKKDCDVLPVPDHCATWIEKEIGANRSFWR